MTIIANTPRLRFPVATPRRRRCNRCTAAAIANAHSRMHAWRQVAALLQALGELRINAPDEKSVVFSQFTGFLDIIQKHLQVTISWCAI
jgi:SNF2 family DNA or RNA helicase